MLKLTLVGALALGLAGLGLVSPLGASSTGGGCCNRPDCCVEVEPGVCCCEAGPPVCQCPEDCGCCPHCGS